MQYLVLFIFFTIPMYSQQASNAQLFENVKKAYNQQHYGITVVKAMKAIDTTFQELMVATYQTLPYTKKAVSTNMNYFFDNYNSIGNMTLSVGYVINASPNIKLNIQLSYAYEEVNYYSSYIQGIQIFNNPIDQLDLNTFGLGQYIWNNKENKAYYVYQFISDDKDTIPGVLITISLERKNPKNINKQQEKILIEDILSKIKWNQLQKLFSK